MSLRLLRLLPLLALLAGCTPKIGNKCTLSTDCSQLGDRLCDTNQPGGYCTVFNCEPDQCPDSICVAFDPVLDPACGASADGRWPRFERSFCLSTCNSDSDCRDQYQCIDLQNSAEQTARRAQVVDLGAADGGLGFKVCMAATCGDGLKDGAETDVDCGGSACGATCANGKACNNGNDCISTVCVGGFCRGGNCGDASRDDLETDVDCGGPDCAPCSPGQKCVLGSDCANGACNASRGVCEPGTCSDGKTNAVETDVDCGGPVCPPCIKTQACSVAGDCAPDPATGTGYCVGQCPTSKLSCTSDTDCTAPDICAMKHCDTPPIPAVCSMSDAGADGWTLYTPADAGTD